MTEPVVRIEGLTFRYRRATEPAIRDISLTIEPGEVLLVAGPSGCGKSTLIRAINGLIPHAYPGELSGTVTVAGRSTVDWRLRDLAGLIGTVLQDPAKQIVGATVEAELAFGPENLGHERSDIRRRIGEVAEQAGIQGLLGRDTSGLSGGERQLLAVGGILMLTPKVYVVDEPLANLDPVTAARLLSILRSLADAGHSIVIVEHRVEEALDLRPDRVLLSRGGPDALPRGYGRLPGDRGSRCREAAVRCRARPNSEPIRLSWARSRPPPAITVRHRARLAPTRPSRRASTSPACARGSGIARSCTASTPGSDAARSWRSSARTDPARRPCSGPRCGS